MPKSQATTIIFEDNTLAVIDAHENGGLVYGSLGVDLAYLKALRSGFAMVKLQRAHHRRLIIPTLVSCSRRGMNAAVIWRDNHGDHVATIQAPQKFPCYCIYQPTQSSDHQPHSQTLSIVCSTNFSVTQEAGTTVSLKAPIFKMLPKDFADQYRHHIESGIDVEDEVWTQLVAMSKKVMVKSTELSRIRGAGEVGSNVIQPG